MNDKAWEIEINSISKLPNVIIVGMEKGSVKPKITMKLTKGINEGQVQEMFAALFILAIVLMTKSGAPMEDVKCILLDQINDAINRVSNLNKKSTIH